MKPSLLQTVTAMALGLGIFIPFSLPVQAETPSNDRFFCGTIQNSATGESIPTTMAKTPRGNVPMIYWKSTFFRNGLNDFTPKGRCLEVSRRFQSFYRNGTLNYLTTGKINAQNVICVADEYGGPCKGLLLTLEPNDDPQKLLQDLVDIRVRAKGPITRGTGSTYIDVEDFLNTAPVHKETLSVTPVTPLSP